MKIAILTDYRNRNDAYSLTHVVDSQVRMLRRYGHDVMVFVSVGSSDIEGWQTVKCIPVYEPVNYATMHDLSIEHRALARQTAQMLTKRLRGVDVAFTHDWIFTPWKLPLATALWLCSKETRDTQFLHWIHSQPVHSYDWWNMGLYGDNHRIVWLNHSDQDLVADSFRTKLSRVEVIPNIRDLRILFNFTKSANEFIDEYPGLMNATFTQVYPATTDRFSDKGVRHLIHIFGQLKQRGFSVCLVIANGWTGRYPKEDVTRYQRMAVRAGLDPDTECVFTSEFAPFERFVPHTTFMNLLTCSSLFVFPSQAEADPLILAETILLSGALTVLNRSVPVMTEITGRATPSFDFGSVDKPCDPSKDYGSMADQIVAAWNSGIQSRTQCRQNLNMDTIYRNYYMPVLSRHSSTLTSNENHATPI